MLSDGVDNFVNKFTLNNIEPKKTEGGIKVISQSDIMNRINIEFQKPFIKNLYRHLEWQQRVFWAVVGTLQNAYDDLEVDVSLDRITTAVNQYVKQGGF